MARTPKSQIQENLLTKGNEFVFPSSGIPYRGEYHIIQGQAYAGANPSTYPTSIVLEKSSDSVMIHVMGNVGFASAGYELAQQNIETAKGLYDEYKPQQITTPITQTPVANTAQQPDYITGHSFPLVVSFVLAVLSF